MDYLSAVQQISSQFLKNALILSLALNLGLALALGLKGRLAKKPISSLTRGKHMTNESVIHLYRNLAMQDLILELKQTEVVEEGIACGDMALGCLVAFHDFDIKRALGKGTIEERTLVYHDNARIATLTVFPFLSPEQKNALFRFATSERWPLTPRGLFAALKKGREEPLKEAFFHTQIFQKLEALLPGISADLLLNALLEGEWTSVVQLRFAIERMGVGPALFQVAKSGYGVELFLSVAFEYATKRLDDAQVIALLKQVRFPSRSSALFAKQLLLSPRSDEVHYLSAFLLAKIYQKPLEEPFDRYRAVELFCPELSGTGSK